MTTLSRPYLRVGKGRVYSLRGRACFRLGGPAVSTGIPSSGRPVALHGRAYDELGWPRQPPSMFSQDLTQAGGVCVRLRRQVPVPRGGVYGVVIAFRLQRFQNKPVNANPPNLRWTLGPGQFVKRNGAWDLPGHFMECITWDSQHLWTRKRGTAVHKLRRVQDGAVVLSATLPSRHGIRCKAWTLHDGHATCWRGCCLALLQVPGQPVVVHLPGGSPDNYFTHPPVAWSPTGDRAVVLDAPRGPFYELARADRFQNRRLLPVPPLAHPCTDFQLTAAGEIVLAYGGGRGTFVWHEDHPDDLQALGLTKLWYRQHAAFICAECTDGRQAWLV